MASDPSRGAQLGRYLVLDRVARGGYGVVYSAYDPELDRRVALKLLRSDGGEQRQEELLQEARAMARLSHPNVLPVHDVGTIDGRVFMAVELVEGETLESWLSQGHHGLGEILRVFAEAGRGLEAAHAAGLVHRDFKPSNVLIGKDARAQVTDFGLATPSGESGSDSASAPGTPAYMAPEQNDATAVIDARADQFSFCVALFEAVHGARPFVGDTAEELARASRSGSVVEPSRGRGPPRWLKQVLIRGLSPDPAARWPSMRALVDELGKDRSWGRRAVGLVAIGALAGGGLYLATARDPELCAGSKAKLAVVWNDERRATLESAFLGSGLPFAADTSTTVARAFDGWSGAWAAAYRDACEDTHLRGEQSEARLDARMSCLDHQLGEMDAVVSELAKAKDQAIQHAVAAAYSLPSASACDDGELLARLHAPNSDPTLDSQIEQATLRLAEVRALRQTGQMQEAESAAQELLSTVTTLERLDLQAKALHEHGQVLRELGRHEEARDVYYRGLAAAKRGGALPTEARLWTGLVYLVGRKLDQPQEGLRLAELAQASIDAAPSDPVVAASLGSARGVVLRAAGRNDDAGVVLEEALLVWRDVVDETDPRLAAVEIDLGNVYLERTDHVAAASHYQRALEIFHRALGPHHPHVAKALMNLCGAKIYAGEYEQARRHCQRALQVREATLPVHHPEIAETVMNLGSVALELNDLEEASKLYARGSEILEKTVGPDHVHFAVALGNRSTIDCKRGHYELGLAGQRRALAIRLSAFPKHHPHVISSRQTFAECLLESGDADAALSQYEQLLADTVDAPESSRRKAADARFEMAEIAWEHGSRRRAVEVARDAARIYAQLGEIPDHVATWLDAHEASQGTAKLQ
jgi:tetratricopeptide (TPR) repeat protein